MVVAFLPTFQLVVGRSVSRVDSAGGGNDGRISVHIRSSKYTMDE